MNEIEQMANELGSSTRKRIVSRFVGGEATKWILEASIEIVDECLRGHIKELEEYRTGSELVLTKAGERIAKLKDTNRLLCRDLDEAQKVVEARDQLINELEPEVERLGQLTRGYMRNQSV